VSVVKRILEANHFSKTLPDGWIDHAYRAHLKLRADKMEQWRKDYYHIPEVVAPEGVILNTPEAIREDIRTNKPKQSGKKTDKNQLSLF